ncbi:MAG: hypothetical protein ACPGLY_07095 [Rubripirellula sp.]
MNDNTRYRRFVVLQHKVGPSLGRTAKDHLDWMFEQDNQTLETWETPLIATFIEPIVVVSQRLNDHRIAYLDWEGSLGGDRGDVKRVIAGKYKPLKIGKERIQLRIIWQDKGSTNTAQLDFFQNEVGESSLRDPVGDVYRLRISPLGCDTNG